MRRPPRQAAAVPLLVLVLCAVAVSGADPPAKAAAAPAPSPAGVAAAPASVPTTNDCCARLEAIGFQRALGVPAAIIETGSTPDRTRRPATLCTCGAADLGTGAGGAPAADWAGPIQMRNRGGTNTQRFNKIRSYAAYLPPGLARASDTGGAAAPLLGLAGDHIIFMGQANDTLMVKEWAGRELARAMGGGEYAGWATPVGPLGWVPRTAHVELFLVDDGAALGSSPLHYRGVYLASEHIQRGRHQVDLPPYEAADDAAGGGHPPAIMTFLHGEPDPEGTPVQGPVSGKEWMVKWPKKGKLSPDGAAALGARLASFETALFSNASAWRDFMDDAAFRDWFLHTELTKVAKKSYHSAAFMHTAGGRGGPRRRAFVLGPIWSQGQGMGTCCGFNMIQQVDDPATGRPAGYDGPGMSGGSGISPNGWLFSICTREPARCTPLNRYDPGNGIALWFDAAFFGDAAFAEGAAARWRALRAGPWSTAAVARLLAAKRTLLTAGNGTSPALRTLARWPDVLGKPWLGDDGAQVAAAFNDVSTWVAARLAWLDGAWAQAANSSTRGLAYPASYT